VILNQRKHTVDHFTATQILEITDPTIFVDTSEATRQLIERVQLVKQNEELKIELYGELVALRKLGIEPKNKFQTKAARV